MDQYLKDLLKILAFGATIATIPLIVAFAGLQPPWPPAVEYVSAVFILMAALAMWEWGRAAKRASRRGLMILGMALCTIGIGAYLPLYSLYVVDVPDTKDRVVIGTECTASAKLVYPLDCPHLPLEALPSAEWKAQRLWTSTSIMRVQLALVAAWISFTAGLMAFVGAVIAGRPVSGRRHQARESA
ncbi:hypothetical protein GCM10022276_12350 [Sphingomonas limnosediminicola]|uniref:DUF4199 domain-containing protein n=1 Tax=Sphingomonas limnosediminicola TaxID=940133 RepID=A0ABP7L688_9SPHN